MSVTVETLEKSMAKLTITIAAADIEKEMQAVYLKNRNKYSLPGFRKGKVSRTQLERAYGKGLFYEEAVNRLIPTAYADAAQESGLDIASEPALDFVEVEPGKDMVFTATVAVTPEITLGAYKGVEVEKIEINVTEEDVLDVIKKEQEKNAINKPVDDRAVVEGDIATIDFEGFVDGEAFEGGKAEGHSLKLGSGQFIPGFEEQIVGHSIGEEFDVNVKFPEDYHADNLKGKDATFKCKLNGIKFQELPALDDEFAKDVSEFETLDEYKADIQKKLAEDNTKHSDAMVDDAIANAIIEKVQGEIPECMFENEAENMVRDYDNRLRMNGLDLKTYFQYTGMTLESLREQMKPDAEKQVKSRLALEQIAANEKIQATAEEIEAEYARLAEMYGMEADKVKEAVEADAIAEDIKVKKAVDAVREKAVITDVKEEHHHH